MYKPEVVDDRVEAANLPQLYENDEVLDHFEIRGRDSKGNRHDVFNKLHNKIPKPTKHQRTEPRHPKLVIEPR